MAAIRQMTAGDVDRVVPVIRESGWGDRRELFGLFLAIDRCAPLVAIEDGEIVATGCAIANGPVGWVGMIWVRPDRRRRGLGRAITEAVCERLEAAGCESLVLIASTEGKPVYDGMGFRTVAEYAIYEAPRLDALPPAPDGAFLRRIEPGDVDAIPGLHARAGGEDRQPVIERLAPRGWLVQRDGRVGGFLLPTDEATGAVVAERAEDALCLLDVRRHLAPAAGRAAVMAEAGAPRAALDAAGWRHLFTTPRMVRGSQLPWEPALIWGVLGFALG